MTQKFLFKYETKTQSGQRNWGLFPLTENSAILDCSWVPEQSGLLVMMKYAKDSFINRPYTDDKGNYVKNRDGGYKTKETKFPTYYEHFMTNKDEIVHFLSEYVVNFDGDVENLFGSPVNAALSNSLETTLKAVPEVETEVV
jgi:hypothetical protein